MSSDKKYKRGDKHPSGDGRVSIRYVKTRVGGEYWATPEKLSQIRERSPKSTAAWYSRQSPARLQELAAKAALRTKSWLRRRTPEERVAYDTRRREHLQNCEEAKAKKRQRGQKWQKSKSGKETTKATLRRRLKNNPVFRLVRVQRIRLNSTLARVSSRKGGRRTLDILGCSAIELKKYLGDRFHSGMSWDNWGTVWQADHTEPLGLAFSDADVLRLSHHTNLRPLLVAEHAEKTLVDTARIRALRQELPFACASPTPPPSLDTDMACYI